MKNRKSNIILSLFSTTTAALVLYMYSFYQVNPIWLNAAAIFIAIVSWVLVFKSIKSLPSITLVFIWLILAAQYYYLGYSRVDLATSMDQQSDNIQAFNIIVIPIAVAFTLAYVLLHRLNDRTK